MKLIYLILILGFGLCSCGKSDSEIISDIKEAKDFKIELNTYGGLAGYHQQVFHWKNTEYGTLLISEEGTDRQTFHPINEEKKDALNKFLDIAMSTSDIDREMSGGCFGGVDSEYVFKLGFDELILRPERGCDSIFQILLND